MRLGRAFADGAGFTYLAFVGAYFLIGFILGRDFGDFACAQIDLPTRFSLASYYAIIAGIIFAPVVALLNGVGYALCDWRRIPSNRVKSLCNWGAGLATVAGFVALGRYQILEDEPPIAFVLSAPVFISLGTAAGLALCAVFGRFGISAGATDPKR